MNKAKSEEATFQVAPSGYAGSLGVLECSLFGMGQFTISIFFAAVSLLIMPLMTNIMAIPAGIAGMVVLIPKLVAIFSDSAAGVVAEGLSLRARKGRFMLLAGGIFTSLSFYLILNPPILDDLWVRVVYMGSALMFGNLALSALTVAYLASAFDFAGGSSEGTRLMAWRVRFHMAGVLFGGSAPLLIDYFVNERVGYFAVAISFALVGLICTSASWAATIRRPLNAAETQVAGIPQLLQVFTRRSMFRNVVTVYGFQYLVNGSGFAAHAYWVLYVLKGSFSLLTYQVTVMTIAALLSQNFWTWLSTKIGRPLTYMVAACGLGLVFITYGFLGPKDHELSIAIASAQGIFAGGGSLMAWALFLAGAEASKDEDGNARQSLLAGAWSAVEKALFAIGVFLCGTLLQIFGLIPSTTLDIIQPPSAMNAIVAGMCWIPGFGMIFSGILLWYLLGHEERAY